MSDASRAALDLLKRALARGDEPAARRAAGILLDLGALAALREADAWAETAGDEAADLLAEAVDGEAQSVPVADGRATLFCIPVLLDVAAAGPLPTAALRAALASVAAPGERFVLADGWAHIHDLLALPQTGYRRLAHRLAESAPGGAAVLPPEMFPRFPARLDDDTGGAEFILSGRGRGPVTTRLAARFALGLVLHPERAAPSDSLAALAAGELSDDAFATIVATLEENEPAVHQVLDPGPPIDGAVGAAATIDCLVLEARFDAVGGENGGKPVTHFALTEDTLHVAMTDELGRLLDALDICVFGLDVDWAADIITARSAAVVEHDGPETLPRAARAALN